MTFLKYETTFKSETQLKYEMFKIRNITRKTFNYETQLLTRHN